MKNIFIRTGYSFVLLVAVVQSAQSATLTFVDQSGNGEVVPCGDVADLTITSTEVKATGTATCLNAVLTDGPTAARHDLGVVDTSTQTDVKNLTDDAVVKLPLKSVVKATGPNLPGARVDINYSTGAAIYYAPGPDDISASTKDYFTYTITDATGKSSEARVDVFVNWVEAVVLIDGCTAGNGIVCMGPTPGWPEFHEPVNHSIPADTTHVWSFVYDPAATGQIGPVFAANTLNFKISDISGDTRIAEIDCWRDGGDYAYYEPAPGTDPYACDLIKGQQYYFNIRNIGAATSYQLKGFDDQ